MAVILTRNGRYVLLLIASVLLAASQTSAWARQPANRNKKAKQAAAAKQQANRRAQLQARLNVVERAKSLADVERNQQSLRENSASQKLSAAQQSAEQTRTQLEALAEEREEIEARLLEEAGADSPLGQAGKRYEEQKQALEKHRTRVLQSPEYVESRRQAESRHATAAELAELQNQALQSDREYQNALIACQAARAVFMRLRQELLSANEGWQQNVASARELKAEQQLAEQQANASASQKLSAAARRREAETSFAAANSAASELREQIGPTPAKSAAKKKPANKKDAAKKAAAKKK